MLKLFDDNSRRVEDRLRLKDTESFAYLIAQSADIAAWANSAAK